MLKKNYSIELFRIICMLFIIMIHLLGHGNGLPSNTSNLYSTGLLIQQICRFAVPGFMMISGYVLYNKQFRLCRFIKIVVQVQFYSLIFYFLSISILRLGFNRSEFIMSLFPVLSRRHWYVTDYVVILFISPFINIISEKLDKITFQYFIVLLLVGMFLVPDVVYYSAWINTGGIEGILYFIVFFIIGSYFGKFKPKFKYSNFYPFVFFAGLLLMNRVVNIISSYNSAIQLGTSFLAALYAISMFSAFLSFKPKCIKLLQILGPSTFGVYLLHDDISFKSIMWDSINVPYLTSKYCNNNAFLYLVLIALICIVIFLISSVIELLRSRMFKILHIDDFLDNLSNNIQNHMHKLLYKDNSNSLI